MLSHQIKFSLNLELDMMVRNKAHFMVTNKHSIGPYHGSHLNFVHLHVSEGIYKIDGASVRKLVNLRFF